MSRQRAPAGVVTDKPIALRLLPDERKDVEALAAQQKRPLANMSRILVLMGIEQLRKEAKKKGQTLIGA